MKNRDHAERALIESCLPFFVGGPAGPKAHSAGYTHVLMLQNPSELKMM
jgi:hypothetical protein